MEFVVSVGWIKSSSFLKSTKFWLYLVEKTGEQSDDDAEDVDPLPETGFVPTICTIPNVNNQQLERNATIDFSIDCDENEDETNKGKQSKKKKDAKYKKNGWEKHL